MPAPTQHSDDFALIHAAQGGDREAFAELVRANYPGVHAFLVVRLPSVHDAEDLAQEVFLTAFRQIATFNPGQPFGPWLRGIALNHLRNHRRKFRAESIGGSEELQELVEAQIEARLTAGNEAARLTAMRECLEQIDGPARALLNAHYGEGATLREIAAKTGRGYSAVAMQVHRLR